MTNEVPTIHSEGLTVERLNSLLDKITSRPYISAPLAAQSIRAALDLHGLTLPILEVEKSGTSTADGPAIMHGTSSMSSPTSSTPIEGEWLYKIKDADGPDDDFDDHLYLYIVMDHINEEETGNAIDCYAQILSSEDLETLSNMTDDDYQDQVSGTMDNIPHEGDRSGESQYQKQVRHLGGLRQEK